jgi:hypothetical protein
MKSKMTLLILLTTLGCASKPVLPIADSVKVSREPSSPRCRELSPVRGTSLSVHATAQDALNDLKKDAAEKGANYVVVQQYSGEQTAVTGVAYDCP